MGGHIAIRQGGPVSWITYRVKHNSRSVCQAKIHATDECAKDKLSIRLCCTEIGLDDGAITTPIYNDNQGLIGVNLRLL